MIYILRTVTSQFLFGLALFTLIRLLFLGLYWSLFKSYPIQELLTSLIVGIRFDLSVLCKLLGLLNLFLFLPFSFRYNRYFLGVIAFLGNILIVIFLLIQVIDLGYYDIVGRRISFELFTMGTALGPTIDMAIRDHKVEIVTGIILVLIVSGLWWLNWMRLFRLPRPGNRPKLFSGTIIFILFFLVLVIGGRGGFQAKPIVENAAFRNPALVLGHLSLNAPFTVMHQFTQNQAEKITWLSDKKAFETTRGLINKIEKHHYPSDKYTFYRHQERNDSIKRTPKHNIVFIIMESWPAHSFGVLGSNHKDISPVFDSIAKKGRLFTRFFSNGTRSIEGIAASLLSIAALPDIAIMMSSFEQNHMVSLANSLGQVGYDSLFIHGIYRGSFGMHEFAQRLGFKRVIAQQDFPDYEKKSDGTWGIWDHIQFEQMIEEIDQMKKPFFAASFSVSSHEPFVVPDTKYNFYPDTVSDYKWLNSLRYTDWALGHFFELAEKKDWYRNTLFIITSDHTVSGRADKTMDSARIPLILYTPSGAIKKGKDARVGTQVDLVPTIIEFLELEGAHNSMGTSLISKNPKNRFGLFRSGSTTWFTDEMAYQFSGSRLLGAYNFKEDWGFKKNIKNLDSKKHQIHINEYKSYLQSAQNALIYNTLSPP
ncbi:MAG: sulfatase-like hydrolase/transferase [Proteobacteria bacterium]|nr:sulfatase-like hydrolase/transferase [Pseudomonadota bacterium]